jgi:D-glycero-alpha-D-manno-heptose 1-phosphate guanylyltransferase
VPVIDPGATDVVILAGGLGTRLQSVVADRPKALAEVNARPFLSYVLDQVERAGFRRVILCTGFRADQIEAALDGSSGRLELVFSREEKPLGTGGALGLAASRLKSPHALVLNGDSFIDADLIGFLNWYDDHSAEIGLIAVGIEDTGRFGTLEIGGEGRVGAFHEKRGLAEPGWINAGAYLMTRQRLSEIPADRAVSLETDVFPAWCEAGLIAAYRVRDRFIDIGTPESYAAAVAFFAHQAPVS